MAVGKGCGTCGSRGWIEEENIRRVCEACEAGAVDHKAGWNFLEADRSLDRALDWYYDHKAMEDRARLPIFATLAHPARRTEAPTSVTRYLLAFRALGALEGLAPESAAIWRVMMENPEYVQIQEHRGILGAVERVERQDRLLYRKPDEARLRKQTGLGSGSFETARYRMLKVLKPQLEMLMASIRTD